MRLAGIGARVLNLIYPRRAVCMGCGSMLGNDRDDICEACRKKLAQNWVGVRKPEAKLKLDGTAFAHPYDAPANAIIRRLKYGSVWVLADAMGEEIARAAMQLHAGELKCVTAVPMHPRRQRVRGNNHAELLAMSAARHMNLKYMPLLRRTRNAPQQARLDAEARARNLKGGFAVCAEYLDMVRGANVLLVDDVFTTGGTASACAEALRDAGARRVWFAAYAVGKGSKNG